MEPVRYLRLYVAKQYQLNPDSLLLALVWHHRIVCYPSDKSSLSDLQSGDCLHCFQLVDPSCQLFVFTHAFERKTTDSRSGLQFILSPTVVCESKEVLVNDLITHFVLQNLISSTSNESQATTLKKLKLCDNVLSIAEWQGTLPSGDPHFNVKYYIVIYDVERMQHQRLAISNVLNNLPSLQSASDRPVSLEQCFRVFESSEQLAPDNPWFCPSCNQPKQAIKTIELSEVPQILVVHLKRFTNASEKVTNIIQYPEKNLKLTDFVHDCKCSLSYNLFAVSCHVGSTLEFGHYTALCLNKQLGIWHSFDDTYIVKQSTPQTQDAYLLFYELDRPTEKQ